MSDSNPYGNAVPQNPEEAAAQQDHVESILSGQDAQEQQAAAENAQRLGRKYGLGG